MTIDKDNNSLFNLYDDFNMYIEITNKANNSLPYKIIQNKIFNHFKVKKKISQKNHIINHKLKWWS